MPKNKGKGGKNRKVSALAAAGVSRSRLQLGGGCTVPRSTHPCMHTCSMFSKGYAAHELEQGMEPHADIRGINAHAAPCAMPAVPTCSVERMRTRRRSVSWFTRRMGRSMARWGSCKCSMGSVCMHGGHDHTPWALLWSAAPCIPIACSIRTRWVYCIKSAGHAQRQIIILHPSA